MAENRARLLCLRRHAGPLERARAPAARGDALGPAFNDTALHLFPRWPDGEGGGEGGESDKRE